ncbi:hypothetical protein [Streptomyces sp. GESEQ-35]|uniref:hypothetical protein n=1 Tax=Streptomyces sp. GESEQ-35 TaxID=2812657 RepID=UPI001B32DDD1|nr:hypothetical protein [Streptomyces sp. GESEQ-35]
MASDQTPDASHSGGTEETGRALTPEERAEYERLRRAATVRHRRARKAGATVLFVLTLLLAPLAVVAAWVNDEVSDTGQYVKTVAPLASDRAVQKVVTDRLTERVVRQVDVDAVAAALSKALADSGAPPRVVDASEALAGPLRSAVTTVVRNNVERVITSDVFRQAWEVSNRRAHAAVVNVLTGEGEGALRDTGETVQLDIGTVVDEVRQRLVDQGFDQAAAIPNVDRTVTLFETEQLGKAQDGMRLLDIMGTWLPVLTVVLAALTVWTAPAHRVMLMITAVGIGVMMVVLLVALAVVRRVYLDSVPSATLPPDAAGTIFDTFLRFLRDSARTLLVVAVITALAAYMYGPGRVARGVRTLARRGATAAGQALSGTPVVRTGSTGRWLDAHWSWTGGAVIGAGALALLLWNRPTVAAVVLVLVLVLVVLAVMEVLAATGAGAEGEPGRAEAGP